MQVFLSAKLPAAGVSVNFDALSNRYPPAKALQMILRKALDDYEVSLSDGTFAAAPQTYPTGGESIVQTSRIMAQTLLDKARSHFDPLGFESTRAFGLNLATAALALFFKNEAKRRAR